MIQEAAGIRKILPQTATALDVCCVRGGAVTTTREACHACSLSHPSAAALRGAAAVTPILQRKEWQRGGVKHLAPGPPASSRAS